MDKLLDLGKTANPHKRFAQAFYECDRIKIYLISLKIILVLLHTRGDLIF